MICPVLVNGSPVATSIVGTGCSVFMVKEFHLLTGTLN